MIRQMLWLPFALVDESRKSCFMSCYLVDIPESSQLDSEILDPFRPDRRLLLQCRTCCKAATLRQSRKKIPANAFEIQSAPAESILMNTKFGEQTQIFGNTDVDVRSIGWVTYIKRNIPQEEHETCFLPPRFKHQIYPSLSLGTQLEAKTQI